MRRGACILALVAACGKPYAADTPPNEEVVDAGSDASEPTTGGPTPVQDASSSNLPECGAQRVVHLVGAVGGLAWFTLVWPLPDVIDSYQTSYAYDDPARVLAVGTDADHPLYARLTGTHATLFGTGTCPNPSAFVIGINQTHTQTPITTRTSAGEDVLAAGAAAQNAALAPKIAFLKIGKYGSYSPKANEPAATEVADIDEATQALVTLNVSKADLSVPSAQIDDWAGTAPSAIQKSLAQTLAFSVRAFRVNAVGTVLSVALPDDPHGAFSSSAATTGADTLAHMLDAFYTELAKYDEPDCGHNGAPLSLADNVILVISGDTPKNSFNKNGWNDNTASNSNFVYVRSNGFTKPGWFGSNDAMGGRKIFDPATGLESADAGASAATDGALTALLYAITRGNKVAVAAASKSPYAGIITP